MQRSSPPLPSPFELFFFEIFAHRVCCLGLILYSIWPFRMIELGFGNMVG